MALVTFTPLYSESITGLWALYKHTFSWCLLRYMWAACSHRPAGYICPTTNIIQATNEFLKSTIKRETAPAADSALALGSLSATYTSNIPTCCFASITFSIKSDISSKSSPWGGKADTKGNSGEGWRSSHVQCVRSQRWTDSIITESAIKAITCVFTITEVIKANIMVIY